MSKLEQIRSRPPTHVLTTRIEAQYLATLELFWREQGELPKSMSELLRLSVESFVDFLVQNNFVTMVQSTSDALEIINNIGLRIDKTLPRNLAKALVEEGADLGFLATPDPAHSHKQRVAKNPVSSADLASVKARLEAQEREELERRVKEEQEKTTDLKEQLSTLAKNPRRKK